MQEGASESLIGPDLVLLLLAAPTKVRGAQGSIRGITRLEKLLFLATKEANVAAQVSEPFEFISYDYGPYSREVYEAVELLEEAGLLREEAVTGGQPIDDIEEAAATASERAGVERHFYLTEDGSEVAKLLQKRNPDLVTALAAIKDKYASLPLRRLIRYVYTAHPEYTQRSLIKDEVLDG